MPVWPVGFWSRRILLRLRLLKLKNEITCN
jgi:hypothetical protein